MANNKNGKVGLPSHKLSFNPSTKGKNTTKPIDKFLYEACEERYGVDPDIDRSKAEENYFESQLDKSFSFIEATQEEKDEYIQNKRLGNVQNGRDSILYKVQQAKENDILIEQQQEILAQQDVQLSAIDEQREELKAQEKAFEEKQREYLQQPVPQNHIKERKAGVFNKEEVVELPKTEYEETISQLRAVKLENEAKDTIIKEKEEQIEQLATQVEELTPFKAFVLGIIELFADKRIEPATRLDMVELSIKHSFPSLFQKAKEKLQQTVKRLPTFTPTPKNKNYDKSKTYDDVKR